MKGFLGRACEFLRSEEGPSATEYALLLALLVLVAVGAMTSMGESITAIFTGVDDQTPV